MDQASFFKQQGYYSTASEILALSNAISNKQIDHRHTFERVQQISDTFSDEFANIIELGRNYRKRCFTETRRIVFNGFALADSGKTIMPPEFGCFIDQMNKRDEVINPMSESFGELFVKKGRSNRESIKMFSEACHTYTQGIGILLPTAKILYGLICMIEGNSPQYSLGDEIWTEYHNLEKANKIPIALENWPEKNNIRNAISHYQADYNPETDEAHFIAKEPKSGKVTYDKTMSFLSFYEVWMQVADAQDSLRYAIRLYGILQDLAVS